MPRYLKYQFVLALSLFTCLVSSQNFLIFSPTEEPNPSIDTTSTTPPPTRGKWVLVNNMPVLATMAPFVATAAPPTPQFLECFGRCPTTPQYSPICASNRQTYFNEQKFNCALFCGADIQIVRHGSCEGLFPMQRG